MAVSGAVVGSTPAMQMDRDANGRIPLAPLTGFGLVLVAESVCMLRLEFVTTREQQRHEPPDSIQLALTPAQARTLADTLLATAKEGYAARPDAVVN